MDFSTVIFAPLLLLPPSIPSRTEHVALLTTATFFGFFYSFYFVLLMVMYLQFIYNFLPEVSIDDILSQCLITMHTYIQIYIHVYLYRHTLHTYTPKVLATENCSWNLMVSSYDKSYQQYFDTPN